MSMADRGMRLLAGCTLLLAIGPGAATVGRGATDDGDWPMAAHDNANTRYSALDQLTAANVRNLKPAFTFSLGAGRGQEAAPVVAGGTMYVATPFPNTLYALDLTRPGAPLKWKFEPGPRPAAQGAACCDVVSRGVAVADGRVFMNTLDGQAIAVDAATGKEVWRTRLADVGKGETITMAPLVVKDRVLVGNSGGEFGVRGWLAALDTKTGRQAWRAWSTGPDKDVLIGPAFTPRYEADRGRDLGVKSWPTDAWKTGGGAAWGWISYDREADLVYYGTGNPAPWNAAQRPGANKWTAGIFARRPSDGQARWFYQFSPHDLYGYDGVNENVLLDLAINGRQRRVLVHPDRNGYVYVMDRLTGEVLSAEPFVHVTTSEGVDVKTGQLKYNPDREPRTGQAVRDICPAAAGGKNWQPSAWSPRTGLLYIPHQDLCQDSAAYDTSYIAGTPYIGMDNKMVAGPGGSRGLFTAWDVAAGRKRWSIAERFPVWSGALVTAGDVVFYGTMDGWFKAVDARTGAALWRFKTDSGIVGQPVTYRGPDGRQYVAILAGVGGWAGAIVSGGLDRRDGTAAAGFVNAMKDLPSYTGKGGTLYVFALP
jgi:PQQ-dependent dehydrogenase (methanol/ethanol family)